MQIRHVSHQQENKKIIFRNLIGDAGSLQFSGSITARWCVSAQNTCPWPDISDYTGWGGFGGWPLIAVLALLHFSPAPKAAPGTRGTWWFSSPCDSKDGGQAERNSQGRENFPFLLLLEIWCRILPSDQRRRLLWAVHGWQQEPGRKAAQAKEKQVRKLGLSADAGWETDALIKNVKVFGEMRLAGVCVCVCWELFASLLGEAAADEVEEDGWGCWGSRR